MMVVEQTEQDSKSLQFKELLVSIIPHLRAFGRALSGRPDLADDLVQETLLKAWAARARFEEGTNMRAWTFVILRNTYLSQMRRTRFSGDYDERMAETLLSTPANQSDPLHLADIQRGLMQLSTEQREALILVGAGGFGYEEAAKICQCAVGTMKSRVARARAALTKMVEEDKIPRRQLSDASAQGVHAALLQEVDRLSAGEAALD